MALVELDLDEAGLRRLADQLRAGKVVVKLFLRHPLHAKLYLLYRHDPNAPTVGYLGSSNLTFSGLSGQGELNIDVMDYDAGQKLARWFEDRWDDRWCVDISAELAEIIDQTISFSTSQAGRRHAAQSADAVPVAGVTHAGERAQHDRGGGAARALADFEGRVAYEPPDWVEEPFRGGVYDPVMDDGVKVNLLPLQEAGLLRYRKVV